MVVQSIKHLKYFRELQKRESKMTARATLICRQNSHPFQDRTLILDQPAKVGRAVARVRPADSNAIFDCKVLSRNHALLWYENGKFYLQDTKSSNGTFVNNQRLSKGSEESAPREVCSGDIVQFGVDVMENSRTAKVTHGCIVATLKIYLPDGKEAKASPSTVVLPPFTAPGNIPTQDLYQLAQYLREALHREKQLENKLATLQKLVANSTEASETGWKALIDEDRLLTRLEILESQLQTYSKSFGDDKLREEVAKLQDDKNNYQISAKEALMKALQEKLETLRKLHDVEHNLGNAQYECSHVREMSEKMKVDLEEMAEKYNNQLQEIQELTDKLQESQRKHEEAMKNLEDEKSDLKSKCDEMKKQEEALQAKIEALQADNDFTHQQLTAMKVKFESIRHGKMDGDIRNVELKMAPLTETQETQVNLLIERIEGDMASNLRETLRHSEDEVCKLKRQLQLSEKELVENKDKVNELQLQLQESRSVDEANVAVTKHLQDEILRLEEELKHAQSNSDSTLIICKNQENGSHMNHIGEPEANLTNSLKAEIEKLKELLSETREKKKIAEMEVTRIKAELEQSCNLAKKYTDESLTIRQHLQNAQQQSKDKSDIVARLQEQLVKAEVATKQQILALKEKLSEEQQRNQEIYEETNLLRQQLLDVQQANKQIQNEAKQMRDKIKSLMDDVDKRPQSIGNENSNEYLTLKEDCASLRNRLHTTEVEMRKARNENSKLKDDYSKLQEYCQKLDSSIGVHERLNENQLEDDEFNFQLSRAHDEILQLKIQYNACNEEKIRLKEQLHVLDDEYRLLSYQTRTIGACSVIPLILFILGVALAFYPTLASITATHESPNPP